MLVPLLLFFGLFAGVVLLMILAAALKGARPGPTRPARGGRSGGDEFPPFAHGSMFAHNHALDSASEAHRRDHEQAMHSHPATADHSPSHDAQSQGSPGGSWDSGPSSDAASSSPSTSSD